MKVWAKVHLKDKDKDVDLVSKSLTNYIYSKDTSDFICRKYNISKADQKMYAQVTANRIAGLLMLYLAKDKQRINDIVNKYNLENGIVTSILPEIEGFVNK